jgi:uncharacterized protein
MDKRIIEIVEKEHTREDVNYHIKIVAKNALRLAKIYNADKEIIEIASWLHDISRAKGLKPGDDNLHHISGAEKAEKILIDLKYPEDKIKKIKRCILTHRGAKSDYIPESIEEKIVANADAMAHFDAFLNLFSEFVSPDNFDDGIKLIEAKIERDWNRKLTLPEARKLVEDKYTAIKLLFKSLKEK